MVFVLLAGAAVAFGLTRLGRGWFERDVRQRCELVVAGARQALFARWTEPAGVEAVLRDMSEHARILGAAACSPDGTTVARSGQIDAAFECGRLARDERFADWSGFTRLTLPGLDEVAITAVPVRREGVLLGGVVLVHEFAFVARREKAALELLLVALGVGALLVAGWTLVSARLSLRAWTRELRRLFAGGTPPREFEPLLGDMRDLVSRLVADAEQAGEGGGQWNPDRLRATLARHLHGEKVIVVANREPYIHERVDGQVVVRHPASGLVTALEPIMRACSGVWIAHGSGSADRERVDANDRVRVPPGEESYSIRRLWLSKEEERGYYYGLANEGLWPLCHIADARPTFRAADWTQYERVNARFAAAVGDEAEVEDPIVLVQDYHFALAPALIRRQLPRATVLTFWHIPWPNSERFEISPFSKELLEGLLGSSILGFHTQQHCNHFLDAVDRQLEARIDREQQGVVYRGRLTLVRAYPISIEWPSRWGSVIETAEVCGRDLRGQLGVGPDVKLGVGVDRLDYTKGIEERLLAVERLLERAPKWRGRFTFVQFAAPSRTEIERYRALGEAVEAIVARVNARFGTPGYQPIILRRAHHEPIDVFRYYRAADLCYVSSLHDGMNLVAKEFVAARDDEQGVLVLSRFTGAARELTQALIVNPYDLDEASAALERALSMPPEEQRERLRAMRALVSEYNVYRWAGRMLVDAARQRSRERVALRIAPFAGTGS